MVIIMTSLVFVLAYQSLIYPPGGVWGPEHGDKAGLSVLATNNPAAFQRFFISNLTAFLASIAVWLLVIGFPPVIGVAVWVPVIVMALNFSIMGAVIGNMPVTLSAIFTIIASVATLIVLLMKIGLPPLRRRCIIDVVTWISVIAMVHSTTIVVAEVGSYPITWTSIAFFIYITLVNMFTNIGLV